MRKPLLYIGLAALLLGACKDDKTTETKSVATKSFSFKKEGKLLFVNQQKDTLADLEIEFAENSYEHQTGLMYRESMLKNRGMLFVYPNEQPRPNFYMKNTYIPLDLVYINAQNIIVDINRDAKPMDEQNIPSKAPSQFVLEINAGMADAWKLTEGDSVVVKRD